MHKRYDKIADGNTSLSAAVELCQTYPFIKTDFEEQAKVYKWDEEKFDLLRPFCVYWFARNVVNDEWLPGEDIIMKDGAAWTAYVAYVENLRSCDCVGWSTKENPDFVVGPFSQIKGWKPGRGPVGLSGKRAKRTTLSERFGAAETMDRIAKQMEDFKKQKKLENAREEGNADEN